MRADVTAVKNRDCSGPSRVQSLRASFFVRFRYEAAIPCPSVLSLLRCPAVLLIPGKNHSHSARLLNQKNKSLPNPEKKMQRSNARCRSPTDGNALSGGRRADAELLGFLVFVVAGGALADAGAALQEAALLGGAAALEPDRARVSADAAGNMLAL